MSLNYQYVDKPLKVNIGDTALCNYSIQSNPFAGTPVPQNQTINGQDLSTACLPTFNSRNNPEGFGHSVCKNKSNGPGPVHISFDGKESNCYSDNACTQKINTCYDTLL